jgi:hypothetical protein
MPTPARLARVKTVAELEDEAAVLRRALGWDAAVLTLPLLVRC